MHSHPTPNIKATKEFLSLLYNRVARLSTSMEKTKKIPKIFEIIELQAASAVLVDMDVEEKDGKQNPVSAPELQNFEPFHCSTRKNKRSTHFNPNSLSYDGNWQDEAKGNQFYHDTEMTRFVCQPLTKPANTGSSTP